MRYARFSHLLQTIHNSYTTYVYSYYFPYRVHSIKTNITLNNSNQYTVIQKEAVFGSGCGFLNASNICVGNHLNWYIHLKNGSFDFHYPYPRSKCLSKIIIRFQNNSQNQYCESSNT